MMISKKQLVALLFCVFFGMGATTASAYVCKTLTMAEMNWDSSRIITAVSRFLIEQGYGCKVDPILTSTVSAAAALKASGRPDIIFEMWGAGKSPLYQQLIDNDVIRMVGTAYKDGGLDGWYISRHLVSRYPQLKTIQGILANPHLVGNEFHNCPSGWTCYDINENLMKAFKFHNSNIRTRLHASDKSLLASIAKAFSARKPWFGYYWEPSIAQSKYHLYKVDMGPYVKRNFMCAKQKRCKNPKPTDFAVVPVSIAVTSDLARKHADIARFMSKVSFTNQQISDLLLWKEEKNASIDETAAFYISNYGSVWKRWLNDKARSKLMRLL